MTRDPFDVLREANPVPQPVSYTEPDVSRHIAAILDRDGQRPQALGSAPSTRHARARWVAAALSAAAVVVLTVGIVVALTRSAHDEKTADAGPMTCSVSTAGGSAAVRLRLQRAKVVVVDRTRLLGGSAHAIATDASDGSVRFTPRGVPNAETGQICRASTLAIRPLITRPVTADASARTSSSPLASLRFRAPATENGYHRLTTSQRDQLAVAMSHYDCAPASTGARPVLACSTGSAMPQVLLLGAAVVEGADVHNAQAIAPSSTTGSTEWTVHLSLGTAGAARLKTFTGRYHTDRTAADPSGCGEDGPVPCSDFLAINIDGRVFTVSATVAVLDSSIAISAHLDESSTKALAAGITAASIQLHER